MLPSRTKLNCKNKWLRTQNIKINKSLWTDEEDTVLRNLVQANGTKNWAVIAIQFSQHFAEKERSRKQCRERWLNYLDPDINKYCELATSF